MTVVKGGGFESRHRPSRACETLDTANDGANDDKIAKRSFYETRAGLVGRNDYWGVFPRYAKSMQT